MFEMTGPYGTAQQIPPTNFTSGAMIDGWVVTAPAWHPLWSQYFVGILDLADMPGLPPADLHRPGMRYEVSVVALQPEHGPYEAARIGVGQTMRYLTPINIAEQFDAPEDQARELLILLIEHVLAGILSPEVADAPTAIREMWGQSVHATLDHYKDPSHGMAN